MTTMPWPSVAPGLNPGGLWFVMRLDAGYAQGPAENRDGEGVADAVRIYSGDTGDLLIEVSTPAGHAQMRLKAPPRPGRTLRPAAEALGLAGETHTEGATPNPDE
jgi:hypothetical protein